MKKRTKLQLSLLLMLSAAVTGCSIEDNNPVDPIDPYDSEEGGVYNPNAGSAPEGVVAVDLGLPSGTLWANMNVGATSPEDYGLYFAWGETTGYTDDTTDGYSFNWKSYKWCNGSIDSMTKYCTDRWHGTVDNKTVLDLEDDAAYANWGGDWCMPTVDEIQELRNNTTSEWTTVNGVKGCRFRSKTNGNSVFLPAAGYRDDADLSYQGQTGYYWSAGGSGSYYARGLFFGSGYAYWGNSQRYDGFTVRPVLIRKRKAPEGVKAVDLGLPSGTKWANMNVGATSPEDYGLYFAWGETKGYTDDTTDGRSFDLASYKWASKGDNDNGSYYDPSYNMIKYCTRSSDGTVDNKTVLDLEDDAAYVNWGGDWRMPTVDEIQELLDHTTREWARVNGIYGVRYTSKNGKYTSIFLPYAGRRSGTRLYGQGKDGYYWSASLSLNSFQAHYLELPSRAEWYYKRAYGFPVRPVLRE